jgi:hypothetical protein
VNRGEDEGSVMSEDRAASDDPTPFPWFARWAYVGGGVTCFVAFLIYACALIYWLLNHHMGSYPVWFTTTQIVCLTVVGPAYCLHRFGERRWEAADRERVARSITRYRRRPPAPPRY